MHDKALRLEFKLGEMLQLRQWVYLTHLSSTVNLHRVRQVQCLHDILEDTRKDAYRCQ